MATLIVNDEKYVRKIGKKPAKTGQSMDLFEFTGTPIPFTLMVQAMNKKRNDSKAKRAGRTDIIDIEIMVLPKRPFTDDEMRKITEKQRREGWTVFPKKEI